MSRREPERKHAHTKKPRVSLSNRKLEEARKTAVYSIWKKARELGLIKDLTKEEELWLKRSITPFKVTRGMLSPGSRYMLEMELGSGIYGTVWKGRDLMTGTSVIVKILQTKMKNAREFESQAKILSSLREHPNILGLKDASVEKGHLWLISDFVEGAGNLESYLETKRQTGTWISIEETREIIEQCLEALEFAHSKGIVHGNITLRAILLDEKGKARLTDFGESIAMERQTTYVIHDHGMRTIHDYAFRPDIKVKFKAGFVTDPTLQEYTAPEVLLGHSPNPQSDLFSLGVVAYILLTQRNPFIDSTGIVSTKKLIESRTFIPPEPRTIEHGVSLRMSKTVMRLLNKNKKERFRSAEEALRQWSK